MRSVRIFFFVSFIFFFISGCTKDPTSNTPPSDGVFTAQVNSKVWQPTSFRALKANFDFTLLDS